MDTVKIFSIEKILAQKMVEVQNMFDERFAQDIKDKCYFAGGCIYSLYHDQEPKDYDIFCTDKILIESLKEYCEQTHIHNLMTENAISIKEFQIITKWVGAPDDIVGEFDFYHNMSYYYQGKIKVITEDNWFEDNFLKFNASRARDIASTLTRIPKFVSRGMKITRKEVARILDRLCDDEIIDYERNSIKKFCSTNSDGY